MTDPVEQDTREYHDKLANYNRAIEALIPVVKEDYTFFESFLMDEHPDIYNGYTEGELKILHRGCNERVSVPMFAKWQEYVEEEARRRADG